MATGMRHWSALAAGGLVVVALLALPPSRLDTERPAALPEVRAHAELEYETRSEVGILQATLWSDSLSELAVRTAVNGVATAVPAGSAVTAAGLEAWTASLQSFVGGMRPRAPDLVFGYIWQQIDWGRPPGAPSSLRTQTQIFAGERDGTPYCLQVRPSYLGPDPFDIRDSGLATAAAYLPLTGLGECRLYVKYGMPGADVGRWMDAGGFRFAGGDEIPPDRTAIEALEEQDGLWSIDAPVFGMRRIPLVDEHPTEGRCLGGDTDACVRFLTASVQMRDWNASEERRIQEGSPLTYAARVGAPDIFGWRERFLLADLERDFGPDAFARFWTSDADVPEAFQEAFGTDLGAWLRDWAQATVGVHRIGPALHAGSPLWVLLTLMVFAATASLVGTRRRVG